VLSLDINRATTQQLDEAAQFFDEHGYLRLSGLEGDVSGAFRQSLADAMGIPVPDLHPLLDPRADASIFPQDVRRRLSRIATSPELAQTLLSSLTPIITTLIGPIAHVSSTYHGQFKGGALSEGARDIATYHNEAKADYMEVHGAYRLHQDFTGASLPTSPSGLTLWVALNACPESTLRLFPGSHRLGMYCHKMWKLDDPRLASLPAPIDVEARVGTGVIFNALLLHGTGKLGTLRRVSCDLRFFPLCGFLPSEAHLLDSNPIAMLRRHQQRADCDTLLTPVLEQLAYLAEDVEVEARPSLSMLNWANYVVELLRGRPDSAIPHLTRFINTDLLEDPPSVFTQKFHNRQIHVDRLGVVRERVAASQVRH
jgi:hypothetical protein